MKSIELAQIADRLSQREKQRNDSPSVLGASMAALIFTCIAEFFFEVDKSERSNVDQPGVEK